jgi:hypothetical protein
MKGLRCLGTKLASFPGAERACGRGEKGAVQRWQPFFFASPRNYEITASSV